jgi:hypothetical protein
MTKEIVTALFLNDLKALLNKYNAEITCADHYQGYPECGEDVRMTVEIPSKYDSGELIQEWMEIDLGHRVDGI